MGKTLLAVFTLPLALACGQAVAPESTGATDFLGQSLPEVLDPSGSVSCFADTAAVSGYYRDLSAGSAEARVTLTSDPLKTQSTGGGYRISFDDDQASVLDEVLNQTYRFQVHSRRSDGVVLLRGKGVGVEVITIDPRNGSFILADAGVSQLWNRASVWVGRCY